MDLNKIKVLLFDDNKVLREFLAEIINDSNEYILVGASENCLNLKKDIEASNPDVVIMDISMPKMNGIEAVRKLRLLFPDLPILMQTMFDDDDNIFNAIAAGANGYILKHVEPNQLLQAIKDVYEGGSPMTPSVARRVLNHLQQKGHEKEDFKLTAKETEVLQLLVKGLPHKQIADKMNITYDTVRCHVKKIYEKLHVSSMTEAVAKAIHHGMYQI
ncbi:MAG: response regulator transcription factor [Bacteroidetes bacterium]|nr:response regulator transcription factor [Bacteroidota bacterium]